MALVPNGRYAHRLLLIGLALFLVSLFIVTFGPVAARLAFGLLVYGCIAAWTANLAAAAMSAGSSIVPIAAGSAHGGAAQELFVMLALRSGGVALIAALALLLWGAGHSRQG